MIEEGEVEGPQLFTMLQSTVTFIDATEGTLWGCLKLGNPKIIKIQGLSENAPWKFMEIAIVGISISRHTKISPSDCQLHTSSAIRQRQKRLVPLAERSSAWR